MWRTLLAASLVAGCYNPRPLEGAPCGTTSECPGAQVCDEGVCVLEPGVVMDAPPAIDGMIDAGPDGACTTFCRAADTLGSCENSDSVTCVNGCVDGFDGTPAHCSDVELSNGFTPSLLTSDSLQSFVVTSSLVFSTETGAIVDGFVTVRAAGTGVINGIGFSIVQDNVGVFTFDSLSVTGGSIEAFGTNALGLFARREIVVASSIDVSGGRCDAGTFDRQCGGPDGGAGGTATPLQAAAGCAPGGAGALAGHTGGGGGAVGSPGGDGGRSVAESAPGGAGAVPNPGCPSAALDPIDGGAGGGAGGDTQSGAGGGGGGAVIVAALGSVRISGTINAGGAGGEGSLADNFGGGGGGSGGAILLEAERVLVSGTLAANGGGGGAGDNVIAPSESGQPGTAPAAGGTQTGGENGSNGGAGATRSNAAEDALAAARYTGGGGGGYGRICVHGIERTLSGTFSPVPAER